MIVFVACSSIDRERIHASERREGEFKDAHAILSGLNSEGSPFLVSRLSLLSYFSILIYFNLFQVTPMLYPFIYYYVFLRNSQKAEKSEPESPIARIEFASRNLSATSATLESFSRVAEPPPPGGEFAPSLMNKRSVSDDVK